MRFFYLALTASALTVTWSQAIAASRSGDLESNGDTALSWEASNRWEMVSSGVSRKILGVAEKVSLRQRFAHSGANSSVRFTRFDSEIRLKGRSTTEVTDIRYPFSAIGQLASGCSAFLVGPCHVLTVAHCVYEPSYEFWWSGTEFHAGRSGPSHWSPHGGLPRIKALVPDKWKHGKDFNHDYSMLILGERLGDKVGWLDYGYDLDQELVRVNVAGYPAYENDPTWVNGTMYYDSCRAKFNFKNTKGRVAYHNCDTVGGSSGSPLWVYDKKRGRREVRALHSHAAKLASRDLPTAVKFREDVYNTISKWLKENECA